MHTISIYRGNRPTKQTNTPSRQGRLQYTAAASPARSVIIICLSTLLAFPGGPGLAGTGIFWTLLELRVMEVVVTTGAIRHTVKSCQIITINKPTPSS